MNSGREPTSSLLMLGSLLVLYLALSLGGCSQKPVWYHSLRDHTAFKKDRYECENEAATYIIALDEEGDEDVLLRRVGTCLEVRGYERGLSESIPPGVNTFDEE